MTRAELRALVVTNVKALLQDPQLSAANEIKLLNLLLEASAVVDQEVRPFILNKLGVLLQDAQLSHEDKIASLVLAFGLSKGREVS